MRALTIGLILVGTLALVVGLTQPTSARRASQLVKLRAAWSGEVQYRAYRSRGWQEMPANGWVFGGDRLKLSAGATLRLGGRVIKGPRTHRVPRRRSGARRKMSVKSVLQLLARRARRGAAPAHLGGGPATTRNLLWPRRSVVLTKGPISLLWTGQTGDQARLFRYQSDGSLSKVQGVGQCKGSACTYAVPASFTLRPGLRYLWEIRLANGKAYPPGGTWFVIARPRVRRALADALAGAGPEPVKRAAAYGSFAVHHLALKALQGQSGATAKQLRAQLLCTLCRGKAADRVAGKAFCKCTE